MAAKRKPRRQCASRSKPDKPRRSAAAVRARKLPGEEAWELVHPRCSLDRAEDLDEVRKMIAADEVDIAIDELRWLLNGCSDFLDAHKTLGELALAANDLPLARGHFGYAFRLGTQALKQASAKGPLSYRLPANQAFFEAGKGLVWCLKQLGKREMAEEAAAELLQCDPTDPLNIRGLLAGECSS